MGEIIVTTNDEDFSEWTWATPYDESVIEKISVSAAKLVIEELIKFGNICFIVDEAVAKVQFWSFDAKLELDLPISRMIDYWIDFWSDDGTESIVDHQQSAVLLKALEEAAVKLREGMK